MPELVNFAACRLAGLFLRCSRPALDTETSWSALQALAAQEASLETPGRRHTGFAGGSLWGKIKTRPSPEGGGAFPARGSIHRAGQARPGWKRRPPPAGGSTGCRFPPLTGCLTGRGAGGETFRPARPTCGPHTKSRETPPPPPRGFVQRRHRRLPAQRLRSRGAPGCAAGPRAEAGRGVCLERRGQNPPQKLLFLIYCY